MTWSPEHAEALPFRRSNIAVAIGVPVTKVGNWIDRNVLWQTSRSHGYYRLSDVFDLGGFAALRTANMPEKDCARYVLNYGFYRAFLHGNQRNEFSFRDGKWDIGIYDPNALVSLAINMRTLGEGIFRRIAQSSSTSAENWPDGTFECFRSLYLRAIQLDLLDEGAVVEFEAGA